VKKLVDPALSLWWTSFLGAQVGAIEEAGSLLTASEALASSELGGVMVETSANSSVVQPSVTPSVSLDQLWEEYRKPKRPAYADARDQYERNNGTIRDSFYACNIMAAALLVERKRGRRTERYIKMYYPTDKVALVQPEFEQALWRARALDGQARLLLDERGRKIIVERLYSVIIYLLGVLDSVDKMPKQQPVSEPLNGPAEARRTTSESDDASNERRRRIAKSLEMANRELDNLDMFVRQSAKVEAMKYYLLGMPVGVLVLILLAVAAGYWLDMRGFATDELILTLVAGGIGAVVSVLLRITKGQRIEVDTQAGRRLTALGGSFRPLVGAILGLALYVLLQADLLPLTQGSEGQELAFYAGIAFLAGFSERWAQDMLLRTTASVSSRTNDAESATGMLAARTAPEVASTNNRPAGS
jgi:hypothetical protein